MKNTFIRLTANNGTFYLDANKILGVFEASSEYGSYNSKIKLIGDEDYYCAKEYPSSIIEMINKVKEDAG